LKRPQQSERKQLNYKVIKTGSKGNAVIVEDVLIDCGVSYKSLEEHDFRLVLLTHEHGDHFKPSTVKRIAEDKPLIRFIVPFYMVDKVLACDVPKKRIDVIEPRFKYFYRAIDTEIECFSLEHDVDNVGYLVTHGGESAMYATDTGNMDGIEMKHLNLYLIEANYTEDDLNARIAEKEAAGEYVYEYRVAETHLSKEQAERFILKNAGEESAIVYLHEHNGGNE